MCNVRSKYSLQWSVNNGCQQTSSDSTTIAPFIVIALKLVGCSNRLDMIIFYIILTVALLVDDLKSCFYCKSERHCTTSNGVLALRLADDFVNKICYCTTSILSNLVSSSYLPGHDELLI